MDQAEGERFDDYIGKVSRSAQKCKFEDKSENIVDRMVRSRLIVGIRDKGLQRQLLSKDETFQTTIEKFQAAECGIQLEASREDGQGSGQQIAAVSRQNRWKHREAAAAGSRQQAADVLVNVYMDGCILLIFIGAGG